MNSALKVSGNVYVIDDDKNLCVSIGNLLTSVGYHARTWTSAKEFLNCVPDAAPAVVITDLRMPGIDGLQLHAALKVQSSTLPVIYISGESTLLEGIAAMKLGALEFLIKPFRREALLAAVAEGIERDQRNRQQFVEQARFKDAQVTLSPREREVHCLLVKGFNNREIMQRLGVSLPTAKQYKSAVMRKLGVCSISKLIQLSNPW